MIAPTRVLSWTCEVELKAVVLRQAAEEVTILFILSLWRAHMPQPQLQYSTHWGQYQWDRQLMMVQFEVFLAGLSGASRCHGIPLLPECPATRQLLRKIDSEID